MDKEMPSGKKETETEKGGIDPYYHSLWQKTHFITSELTVVTFLALEDQQQTGEENTENKAQQEEKSAQGTSAPQEVPAAGGEQVPMDGHQAGSQESYEDLSNFAESLLEKG